MITEIKRRSMAQRLEIEKIWATLDANGIQPSRPPWWTPQNGTWYFVPKEVLEPDQLEPGQSSSETIGGRI